MTTLDVQDIGRSAGPEPVRPPATRWAQWLLLALALVPAVWMLMFVRGNNPMQWHDYWDIISRVTNLDGSLAPGNLFAYQNEHPVAIPSLIYWVNAHLAGGSNIALGYFVFLVAMLQIVIVCLAAREVLLWPWTRIWLLVLFVSSLLLAPRSVHNFALAMSGTAWFTANFFAVLALLVIWRRSPILAASAAVLASSSYGTGLVVWPALVVVALLQRRSRLTTGLLIVTTVAVALVYYAGYEQPAAIPGSDRTVQGIVSRLCGVLGSPFSETMDVASLFGAAAVCATVWLLWAHWRRDRLFRYAPWVGLLTYAMGGAGLIALSRGGMDAQTAASRYVSLGALAWISLGILVLPFVTELMRAMALLGFVSLAVFAGGAGSIASVRAEAAYADELAIAIRLGAMPTNAAPYFNNDSLPILPVLQHYPFNDRFSLDCGYFGRMATVRTDESGEAPGEPPHVFGELESMLPTFYGNALRVTGWVASDRGRVRCVLLIDQDNRVVGAAALAGRRRDVALQGYAGATNFNGVVLRSESPLSYRAVAVARNHALPILLKGVLPDR